MLSFVPTPEPCTASHLTRNMDTGLYTPQPMQIPELSVTMTGSPAAGSAALRPPGANTWFTAPPYT